jgi:hypothetical protein
MSHCRFCSKEIKAGDLTSQNEAKGGRPDLVHKSCARKKSQNEALFELPKPIVQNVSYRYVCLNNLFVEKGRTILRRHSRGPKLAYLLKSWSVKKGSYVSTYILAKSQNEATQRAFRFCVIKGIEFNQISERDDLCPYTKQW